MMNTYINYFIEANLSLCFFLLIYYVLLRRSTDFSFVRGMLLIGIASSVIFPFIHLQGTFSTLPTIQDLLPTRMLPVLDLSSGEGTPSGTSGVNYFDSLTSIYFTGVFIYISLFAYRLGKLLFHLRSLNFKPVGKVLIAESTAAVPPFSFFRFICMGNSADLTDREKQRIIAHERIHALRYHSVDVLFLNILEIIFWINPVIRMYKNIFVQLHEFEADARSVDDQEIDDYCSLVARVALLSADLRIANHFSSSLTLKRIQMMRKNKMQIQRWKKVLMAMTIPAVFIAISCQDQVMTEVTELAKSSTVAMDVPEDVQRQYDEIKAKNPQLQLMLVEVDAMGQAKLQSLKEKIENLPPESIAGVHVIKHPITPGKDDFERSFIIVQYDETLKKVQEASKTDNNIYTIVDETAHPEDGIEKFYGFFSETLTYPQQVREKGVEGKVFVSFVVETDGSITGVEVVKSLEPSLDAEAMRVVKLSPKWVAGKNNGVPVRQRLVLPINFSLGEGRAPEKAGS